VRFYQSDARARMTAWGRRTGAPLRPDDLVEDPDDAVPGRTACAFLQEPCPPNPEARVSMLRAIVISSSHPCLAVPHAAPTLLREKKSAKNGRARADRAAVWVCQHPHLFENAGRGALLFCLFFSGFLPGEFGQSAPDRIYGGGALGWVGRRCPLVKTRVLTMCAPSRPGLRKITSKMAQHRWRRPATVPQASNTCCFALPALEPRL